MSFWSQLAEGDRITREKKEWTKIKKKKQRSGPRRSMTHDAALVCHISPSLTLSLPLFLSLSLFLTHTHSSSSSKCNIWSLSQFQFEGVKCVKACVCVCQERKRDKQKLWEGSKSRIIKRKKVCLLLFLHDGLFGWLAGIKSNGEKEIKNNDG
jgi:hypothetical protein